MASPTQWIWVWASSRRWWRIGKPDVVWFIGSQRVGHNWVTEQQKEYVTITWWECDCRERKVLNYLFSIWTNCRGKCCGRYWNYKVNKSSAVPRAQQVPLHFVWWGPPGCLEISFLSSQRRFSSSLYLK